MITFKLIITYILLGAPNELIIPGFANKTDCQIQIVKSAAALKAQGATVKFAICHRVSLDSGN